MRYPLPSGPARQRRSRRPARLSVHTLEARDVPTAFTPGNLIVYRVGDGSTLTAGQAAPVFLDEYAPTGGSPVQSVALPTADAGANQTLTASATLNASEGYLTRTADGAYLVLGGYDAPVGTAGVANTPTTGAGSFARTIARVSPNTDIDTTTTTTSFTGASFRSVASVDGSGFWTVGNATGVVYTPLGGSGGGTIVSNILTSQYRTVGIADGQLYITSSTTNFKGVDAVGTGTPTTTGAGLARLPGRTDADHPSPYGFFFADLSPTVAGVDTLYVADDGVGALQKFTFDGANWLSNGRIGLDADDYRGLTGSVSGTTVTLYSTRKATTAGELVSLVDSSGYNGAFAGTPTVIVNTIANKIMRGVALAPVPLNQGPTNTVPGSTIAAAEDTDKVLTGFAVADPDAGTAPIQVTLSVPSGTLTVATGVSGGLTAGQVTGNGSGSVVLTAPLAAINATLADANGLTFRSAANAFGDVTLTMATDDLGNTGGGGAKTKSDTATISVAPVADDPTVTDATTDEDMPTTSGLVVTRNAVDGNEVTHVRVTGITGGTLFLNNGTTQINEGDFVAYADANAGFKFTPAANFNGTASFQVQASTGATPAGLGGAVRTATITINAVNDGPVNTLPGSFPTDEDSSIPLSGISIADPDSGSNDVVVTLTIPAAAGRLRFTTGISGGLDLSQLSGNNTNAVTVTAPLAAINTTLADAIGLMYFPAQDYNGSAALQMVTDDQGHSGGSALADTDNATVAVAAVNDGPVASVPGDQLTPEDTAFTFTLAGGNPISVSDVDAGANLKLTLTATNGTIMLSGTTGLTDISGWGTAVLTATGTPADLNAALSGMTFTPDQEFSGAAGLKVHVDDQGNTGSGGVLTHFMVIFIDVATVNDAPNIVGPGSSNVVPVNEDEPFALAGDFSVVVNDADAGTGELTATLTATHGTITVTDVPGATITGSGTVAITIAAVLDDLNAALGGLTFTPDADYSGPAAIQMTTDDHGNTGGPAQTDADTFAINVAPANDAPVLGDYAFTLHGAVAAGTVVGMVAATDPENDGITYAITGGNAGGKFAIDPATGEITVVDPVGLPIDSTLTVTATDDGTPAGVDTATVTVHQNTAPTGAIPPQVADEDAATVTLDLTTFFTDVEQPASALGYAVTGNTNVGLFASVTVSGTNLVLTPAANAHGAASITVTATDADGLTGAATFTVTVNPVNDVPTIDTSFTPMLPPIKMPIPRNTFPAGAPLAALTANASDADGQTLGVAITAADPTGKWQYTTNGGVNPGDWINFPPDLATTPLLLADNGQTQVRFIPNKASKGVKAFPKGFAGLTYRAWDGSADLSPQVERAWVAVGKTAPAVDAAGHPLLKAVREDLRQTGAYTVKKFLGLLARETDPARVFGIALSGTTGTGSWEFNTGKGGWQPLGTVSDTQALLLRPTDRVRFKPGKDFDADARLTYHTWVPTLTEFGTKVDLATATGVGGPTEAAILDILSRNDAPVVTAGPSLGSVQVGQPTAAQTVSAFLGGLATDVDSVGLGVQLLPASKAVGTWQYKDGTGNWVDVKRATTLTGATEIRFAAAATATAGAYSLSFKAWDGTPKTPTAFSKVAKATLTITV